MLPCAGLLPMLVAALAKAQVIAIDAIGVLKMLLRHLKVASQHLADSLSSSKH